MGLSRPARAQWHSYASAAPLGAGRARRGRLCCPSRQGPPNGRARHACGAEAHDCDTREDFTWTLHAGTEELVARAGRVLERPSTPVVSFSPKVFLPVTRLCRDSCAYCTFAAAPRPGQRAYMRLDEVLSTALQGARAGCTEALLTLGDRPEARHEAAAAELRLMGFESTFHYVEHVCTQLLRHTPLLPHVNAGVLTRAQLARLRAVSASQGLMLESSAPRLTQRGGPHHACPDKDPAVRKRVIEDAGRECVPFTTGLLVGIGEAAEDRLRDLLWLRGCHRRHGHIQELIIQNFVPKPGTPMAGAAACSLEQLLRTVATARIIFGADTPIQAPPNLTAASDDVSGETGWAELLRAGVNDWGGVSPVTRDYVNPERPWPHLHRLASATAAAGAVLVPRLPVHPAYVAQPERWLDAEHRVAAAGSPSPTADCAALPAPAGSMLSRVLAAADVHGLARGSPWAAGAREAVRRDESRLTQPTGAVPGAPAPDATRAPARDPGAAAREARGEARDAAAETAPRAGAAEAARRGTPAPGGVAARAVRSDGAIWDPTVTGGQTGRAPVVPPPGRTAWTVAVGSSGVLAGGPQPAPSRQIQVLVERLRAQSEDVEAVGSGERGLEGQLGAPKQRAGAADCMLSAQEVAALFGARGADFDLVCGAADEVRRRLCGETVTYVVNRNINYTNICTYSCAFCAFSKGRSHEALRGAAYLLPLEEIGRRVAEAVERGATEVCLQGGIHPDFTGRTYVDILRACKTAAPGVHVHAFSPLEVLHGARTLGVGVDRFLGQLADAGLGSLPGTAAEVLTDRVRAQICPDKLTAAEWLEVLRQAHRVGLRSTSTIMFGHVDSPMDWAEHLLAIRTLQKETGGITEFVPLPFVHLEAPLFRRKGCRRGPTLREAVLMHAVGRLVLAPAIRNIQASWVKMGPQRAAHLLAAGCNDMGGSIMNESITRAAGAAHGQELPPLEMDSLIRAEGRVPLQRSTLYGTATAQQVAKSYTAVALVPLVAPR